MAEGEAADGTRKAGRGLLFIAGAKMWFIVSAYAVHFLLPRLLGSPEAFGLFSAALSAVSIVNNVLIAATVQTLSKLVSENEEHGRATLRRGLRIQFVVGLVLSGVLFAGSAWLSEDVLKDAALTPLLRVSAAVVLSYALYATLVGYLNGTQRFLRQASLDATFSALRTVGILVGAGLGFGVIGALVGFASAAVAILIIASVAVGLGAPGEAPSVSRFTSFMRPVWTYQLFLNGILLVDMLVMKGTLSGMALDAGATAQEAASAVNEQIGYYSAAQKFAFVPYQLMLSLTFIVFPMVSRAVSAGDTEGARRTIQGAVRFALLVLVGVTAPVAGAARGVMTLVYPEAYAAGADALSVLVIGAASFALFVIAATALTGAGRPGLAATIAGIGLAGVVVGDRILIGVAGLGEHTCAAVATGTASGMLLSTIAAGFAVHKLLGGFVAPLPAVRILAVGAVAWAVARYVPHDTRPMALVALVLSGLVFVALLFVTGELGKAEIARVRHVLGRS